MSSRLENPLAYKEKANPLYYYGEAQLFCYIAFCYLAALGASKLYNDHLTDAAHQALSAGCIVIIERTSRGGECSKAEAKARNGARFSVSAKCLRLQIDGSDTALPRGITEA